MNGIRILFALLFVIVFSTDISAQDRAYKAMMKDFSINFYTVCDSFDAYFKNRDKGKGTGYTPFLRWKNENEAKYYPSGNRMVDHYLPYKEFERIKSEEAKNPTHRLFQTGGWQNLGPDSMGQITGHYAAGLGRVEFVEVNRSNAQQIYLGSRSGGLWRTSDEGATWSHHTDFLPGSGVNAIAAAPSHFDSVLVNVRIASNGTSFGVYRSTDGGITFTPTAFTPANVGFGGLGSNFQVYCIKYHPRIANLVFVGTSQGIYRSTNNLQTWTLQISGGDVYDIDFHPTDNNIVYIYDGYYWGTNKNRILKSTNQGVSYSNLIDLPGNNNARIKITTTITCPDCVFASSDNGIWKSYDAGASFVTTVSPAPAGVSLYSAVPNDLDTGKFVSGYMDLFRSTDGGSSFNQCTWWSLGSAQHGGGSNQQAYNNSTKYIHADNNYMDCINGSFYSCSDGFLSKSSDNGVSWRKLSTSVGIRENYRVGLSQSNHYVAICGSQDNGTSIRTQGGWIEAYGADGMEALVHPLNDQWMIGSTQNGGRIRTQNGGGSMGGVAPPGQNASWIAPMFFDPNDHMTVYSLGEKVHKTTNFGTSWVDLGAPASFTGTIQLGAIAEHNSKIIVITKDQYIDLSKDGGLTFASIKGTLPNNYISGLTIDPKHDSTIIVTYTDYQANNQKIFISKNLGVSWQNITYNLGNMPIESVVIDHSDSSFIYVGAAIGVYKKAMNATTWTIYNQNLPNVTVQDVKINWGSNTLRAATWGRGLWEYSLAGRNDFPAVLHTSITSTVSLDAPKTSVAQYVSSQITYSGALTSIFVRWAKNAPNFNNTNVIPMTLVAGVWTSNSPLPDDTAGTKIFFKVYAVGSNSDTSETYNFMYTLKPYTYCAASGESINGNLYMSRFRCANVDNNGTTNNAYTYYSNLPVILYTDSTYTTTGNFNTSWGNNDFVVWIDYNNDAVFSASEIVALDPNTTNLGTGTFTVPNIAVEDTVRLRVRLGYWGNTGSSDDPCGTTLGEVEDYPAIIRKVPTISYSGNTNFCFGDSLNLSYTGSTVDSIKWTLSNGGNNYLFAGAIVKPNTLPAGTYSIALSCYKYGIAYPKNVANAFTIHSLPTVTASNDGAFCPGDNITLQASPAGYTTYAWSGPLAYVVANNMNPVRSSSTSAMSGNYNVTVTDGNGCSASTSTAVTVLSACGYTWNGSVDGNWNNAANWSPSGIPNTCAIDINIPAGTPNTPVINSSNIQVGAVSIANGVNITISNNSVLSVCKNWSASTGADATVTGGGTLVLNGTTAQTISGNSRFAKVRLNNTTGATLTGTLDVETVLELQSGNFNASSGTLTFLSPDENNCAIVDNFSPGFNGTLSGAVIAQRGHVTSLTYGQHYMSTPVNNTPFSSLATMSGANGIPVTATTNCDETQLAVGSNYGNAFEWDQSLAASCMLNGWIVRSSGVMDNAKGYSFIPNSNPSVVQGNLNFGANYSLTGLSDAGWSNTSLQARPYNSGWHLVGNPYLAGLDPNGAGNTAFDNIGGVWHTNGIFAGTYQPLDMSSSAILAPFQAFMVHKASPVGASTFSINNTDRRITVSPFYKSSAYAISLLVSGNGFNDITYIDFDPQASTAFDSHHDGYKLPGKVNQPAIYTTQDGKWLSVQTNPDVLSKTIIPVGFMSGQDGNYTISSLDCDSIANTIVYLKDYKTGTLHNLSLNETYNFQAEVADDAARFELLFDVQEPNAIKAVNVSWSVLLYPNPAKDKLTLATENTGQINATILTIEGKTIETFLFKREYTLNTGTYKPALYIVQLIDEKGNRSIKKFVKQ
jgi:hypothetical protein